VAPVFDSQSDSQSASSAIIRHSRAGSERTSAGRQWRMSRASDGLFVPWSQSGYLRTLAVAQWLLGLSSGERADAVDLSRSRLVRRSWWEVPVGGVTTSGSTNHSGRSRSRRILGARVRRSSR